MSFAIDGSPQGNVEQAVPMAPVVAQVVPMAPVVAQAVPVAQAPVIATATVVPGVVTATVVPVQPMQAPLIANARVVQPAAQFETGRNTFEYQPRTNFVTSVPGQIILWIVVLILVGVNIYLDMRERCTRQVYHNGRYYCAKTEKGLSYTGYAWIGAGCLYCILGPVTIMKLPTSLTLDITRRVYRLQCVVGSYEVPLASVSNIESVNGCKMTPIWTVKGSFTDMQGCGAKGVMVHANGYKDICFSPQVGNERFISDFQSVAAQNA